MAQTEKQYFDSSSNWGKYAYVSLKEIIDNMMVETTDSDSFLSGTKRSKMLLCARRGIRQLSREVKKTVKAIEVTINPSKLFFPLPQDYVDWVRVSRIMPDYRLKSLNINWDIPTAPGYLQDNNYDLMFDNNGYVLTANSSNIYNQPVRKYSWLPEAEKNYGEFVVDEVRGVMGFTSDLADQEVVIEYVSDGLDAQALRDEEVYIHKNIMEALTAFIYSECISTRRNVPYNEKRRARDHYLKLLHQAKVDNLHFNIAELHGKVEYNPYDSKLT